MPKQLSTFPYPPGAPVGYGGQRCTVVYVPLNEHQRKTRGIRVCRPDGSETWARLGELRDPPALPEHVQQAAASLTPFLSNQRSLFGEDV